MPPSVRNLAHVGRDPRDPEQTGAVVQRLLELLREQPLPADLCQGHIDDLVTGGLNLAQHHLNVGRHLMQASLKPLALL